MDIVNDDSWAGRIGWLVKEYAPGPDGSGNEREFARAIGTTGQAVNNWTRGASMPKGDSLAAIAQRFPQINPDWLLTGKGPRTRDYRPAATPTASQQAIEEIMDTLRRFGMSADRRAPLTPDAESTERANRAGRAAKEVQQREAAGEESAPSGAPEDQSHDGAPDTTRPRDRT